VPAEAGAVIKARKSVPSDAATVSVVLIRSIRELCFEDHQNRNERLEPWLANKTSKSVSNWILSSEAYCVTAVADSDMIAGFGMLSKTGEMLLLYVSPDYVGVGAGQVLLRAIESQAIAWGLAEITLDSTVAAKNFYEHHGYRSSKSCRSRLDGLNCHAMRKSLTA